MKYIIYKTTNLINNNIYIGQHATEDINDNYLGSGVALLSDIKKYGKDNFNKEWTSNISKGLKKYYKENGNE